MLIMVYAIILAIIIITVVLAGIGAYIVIHRSAEEEKPAAVIQMSGQYAVVLRPVRQSLEETKPSREAMERWLVQERFSEHQRDDFLTGWENALEKTIRIVDEGDREGITAYRIVLGPKDRLVCDFLPKDNNYITREQIRNHPEILPPYYFGSDSTLAPKHPWEDSSKQGWKPVLPVEGKYRVPDWRQVG
jgi:hypothetical protein